jgi:hypothetical protein
MQEIVTIWVEGDSEEGISEIKNRKVSGVCGDTR